MLKKGNSPYWPRPQYKTLTSNKWDIITIMLGTNDAKDPDSHGPDNWQHDCSSPDGAHTEGCSFASDYHGMVELVRGLGTTEGVAPKVYAMIPPPLMQEFSIGANRTVINTVYPELVPQIAKDNKLYGTIDVYTGMGGTPTCSMTSQTNVRLVPHGSHADGGATSSIVISVTRMTMDMLILQQLSRLVWV